MKFAKQIDFLLENACASIRYLVHRDMLGTPAGEPLMLELQKEILKQENVHKILSAQHPDGWMGYELHGSDSMEGHIGFLLRAGVDIMHPQLQAAVHALTTSEIAAQHKNWFRGGDALDADGRGGNRAVIANILSWVNYPETFPALADEISLSFEHVFAVFNYSSVDDFTIVGKKARWYQPMVKFPGANHIGLLQNTKSWRTEEKISLARKAIKHAYELMKDFNECILFRKPKEFGGTLVGPFNYNWQALRPVDEKSLEQILNSSNHYAFGFWLRSISGTAEWVRQSTQSYELLARLLEEDSYMDLIPQKALTGFRHILGREPSWRKKDAVKCDVAFAIMNACYPVFD